MYIRVKIYNADMVEQTNILLQYSTVKSDRFGLHFCFPGDAPATTVPIFPIDEKTIQCLPNILQHVPIYLQQFPSYSNRKCKKIYVFAYRSSHFCSPPWRRRCDYHPICYINGKTIQCLWNLSQHYLSILNTFRVIWCLSECVSVKIAIFTTFLFPWGDALVIIMLNVILMKKWIGNGWTPSACAYAYTLCGNRTWRAMSATATCIGGCEKTISCNKCTREASSVLCCRGNDRMQQRPIINIPVRMWLAGGRFFIRQRPRV